MAALDIADLPIIDLRDSSPEDVRAACLEFGFFFVRGHGVTKDARAAMFSQSRQYFRQPHAAKMRTAATSANGNRGYTSLGEEILDPEMPNLSEGDTKEGYYLGREPEDAEEAKIPMMVKNVWPELPGWKESMERYQQTMLQAGMKVVRILAESMGVEVTKFMDLYSRPVATTRLLHYAARKSEIESGVIACGAHTDYGMITLLTVEEDEPGLEIEINGKWCRVPPCKDAFIVNLGDMLHRWTNGAYRSTKHRVVNRSGAERFSTAFFFDPAYPTIVEVLPQFCKDKPAQYPPIKFLDHLLEMYEKTHTIYAKM